MLPSQWAPTVPAPPANSSRQIMMSVEPVVDSVRQTVISDVTDADPPNITTVRRRSFSTIIQEGCMPPPPLVSHNQPCNPPPT